MVVPLMSLPPLVSISAIAFFFHTKRPGGTKLQRVLWEVTVALLFYVLPPHSILAFWRLVTLLLSQWPLLLKNPPSWSQASPLGDGCAKVCEVIAAIVLWKLDKNRDDEPLLMGQTMGSIPTTAVAVLVVISVATNFVLDKWSSHNNHTYTHEGVHAWVDDSVGRSLSRREHVTLLGLACINALCEEISSRGVWKSEFLRYTDWANVLQAAVFGWWHYHGIPSGWTGVGLTFVYGFLMGLLQDYYGGLLVPIIAHTIADYFIFAVIARRSCKKE